MVELLAPIAPPCFSSRDQFIEYVKSAAAEQRELHAPGPLLLRPGHPPEFNADFSICRDCTSKHALRMSAQGRCNPNYLRDLLAPVGMPQEQTHTEAAP